jgi:hypothetical protein
MKNVKILFWKFFAKFWDLRPRMHLPTYTDYPIASCEIQENYDYPEDIKVLFEWDEKGKHWVVFSR